MSTIGEHIDALVTYVKSKSGLQTYFGVREITVAEMPVAQITHDNTGDIINLSRNAVDVSIPLTITVYADKSAYRIAYDRMEKILAGAAEFRELNGAHMYWSEGISAEEENGAYKVKTTLTLRRIVN